jgi:DNA-binding NtrC family response regulator
MGLRVLVLEDDEALRVALARHLRGRGAEVFGTESIAEAVDALQRPPGFHALVLDLHLPEGSGLDVFARLGGAKRPAAIVMTGDASVETAVGAMRVGAIDYLLKPFSMDALDAALARIITRGAATVGVTIATADPAAADAWRRIHAPAMLGEHPRLLKLFEMLRRVAKSDCSLVVEGETGAGKELVARAIHSGSGRGGHPFVALNCAAVPEQLMESELFGHGRGAFTGAVQARVGRFVAASKGTLFLDEVGEMPLAMQAKLLRALQEKEITPVGESKPIPTDVRVVAATHRDLDRLVEQKIFREDLLYRLDVIRVQLPALRERQSDIAVLVTAFIQRACEQHGLAVTGIDGPALAALTSYPWPGNVRQLANTVERMVLLRGEGTLSLEDVPAKISHGGSADDRLAIVPPVLPDEGIDLRDAVERFEGALLRQALERTGWNKNRAAALLQLNRTTLVEKLKKRGWTDDESGGRSGGG